MQTVPKIIIDLLPATLDVIGKVMVAYTAIRVHFRFWQEHKVDEVVFRAMRKERKIGIIGISFIVLGYMVHVIARFI
ncbi:MAG: hypothetical protein COU47_03595 [Candidatus Niyogibacteria bacterium CG10_big_fil_rev_8_21_14_0_10_46_36]|uniref:Uncharacterized protein n=1 Tax=Candidatus Niyogibacteria bacterium CG10_big_fil_rev_8_21_14_0_10_46_36 TaxID=1974726 RepID=A0A2H0TCZ1_9BACT|nr:MAG: hypothetical protein COU47_03595 [Candidatus Niyogibacteria bacterium CG10_big_fil_rev_8_21_14_0_10_46_36]